MSESAEEQIQRLATFIMLEVDGEPSQSEGAVDCAIRVIKQLIHARVDSANHLIGKLLTLADAAIKDERQLKAFKDMMKIIIWENETITLDRNGSRVKSIKFNL
ncbi:hypothetical protein ES703_41457 [subsurface metagenome]